jgi:hypothetical protein
MPEGFHLFLPEPDRSIRAEESFYLGFAFPEKGASQQDQKGSRDDQLFK